MCNPLQVDGLTAEQRERVARALHLDPPARLRLILKDAGISGADLARKFNFPESTVYAVINGQTPRRDVREAFAHELDLPIEFLFPSNPTPSIAGGRAEVVQNQSGVIQK